MANAEYRVKRKNVKRDVGAIHESPVCFAKIEKRRGEFHIRPFSEKREECWHPTVIYHIFLETLPLL